jgi:hypothetical protein
MKTNKELLTEFINLIKTDVFNAIESKGLRASGRAQESLRVEVTDTTAELFGATYLGAVEAGRKAGKMPYNSWKEGGVIYEWLAYRKYGINWTTEQERKSIAYLITRKIMKEGTRTFQTQPTGILTENITRSRIEEFIKKVNLSLVTKYTTEMRVLINKGIDGV